MADQACNDSIQLPASAIYSPATGWFYVIVAESESTGPRQPVSNWIPRSGLVSYGVVLALLAAVINALLCLVSLRRRSHGDKSTASGYDETDGGTTSWRRLALINFTVVQLAVGVVIVPVKVMTDTLGMWTIGGAACRIYLLGQVILIAETMWSVVLLVFDALIQTVTMSDGISSTTLRYSEFSRHRPRWIAPAAVGASWLAASTSLFPLGVALTAGSDTGDVVLEDVCAVSMKRDDAVAQAITAFLLPAAVALAGCVAIVCRNFRRFTGLDMQQTNKPGITDNDFWVSPVALTVACCVTWSPFFALYAALPFCPYDRMCIDPGAWTVLAWFGYATSVLGPVCWIVGDRYYRFQFRVAVRRLMSTCSDRRGHWKPQLSSSVKSPPVPTQNDDEEDPTQLLAGQKAPLNKTSLVPSSSGTISEQSSEILVMTV